MQTALPGKVEQQVADVGPCGMLNGRSTAPQQGFSNRTEQRMRIGFQLDIRNGVSPPREAFVLKVQPVGQDFVLVFLNQIKYGIGHV